MCEQYARAYTQTMMQRHFGATDAELPLLRLDPYNWDAPFSPAGDVSRDLDAPMAPAVVFS